MEQHTKPFMGRLRLAACVAERLRAHHLAPGKDAESVSYALGHAYRRADGELTIVLADPDAVLFFAADCFVSTGWGHATLHSAVKAGVFRRAVEHGYSAVVDVHDHHFARAAHFSGVDDRDDLATARYASETVQAFMPEGRELVAAALLIARDDCDARVVRRDAAGGTWTFNRLRVDEVGPAFRVLSGLDPDDLRPRFERHRGIVSAGAQQRLGLSHAVVVGGGGTGSIAVEGLLRLGIGAVSVIDADGIEPGNLNRLQGAAVGDVGRLKVDVLGEIAQRIAPSATFKGLAAACDQPAALPLLEAADFIVGCVDNPETRWWLNRLAVQYMIPWFDCGVLLGSSPRVTHEVRTSVVIPRTNSCGHCAHFEFHPRKTPAAYLDRESVRVQRAAGYIADAPEAPAPSAYPVNLLAVSILLQEVMNWFCEWRALPSSIYMHSNEGRLERLDPTVTEVAPLRGCPVCGEATGRCREASITPADVDLSSVAASLVGDRTGESLLVPSTESTPTTQPNPTERSSQWPSPTPNA